MAGASGRKKGAAAAASVAWLGRRRVCGRAGHGGVFRGAPLGLRRPGPATRALEAPLAAVCVLLEPPRSTSRRDPAAQAARAAAHAEARAAAAATAAGFGLRGNVGAALDPRHGKTDDNGLLLLLLEHAQPDKAHACCYTFCRRRRRCR